MKKIILLSLFYCCSAIADPLFYAGRVTQVWPSSEGFLISMDTNVLDDCVHNYAYFKKESLGATHYNGLYSMVLSAFHSGDSVRVLIDKDENGNLCFALSARVKKFY